jgi:uncharacterized delta-60 repeat protein
MPVLTRLRRWTKRPARPPLPGPPAREVFRPRLEALADRVLLSTVGLGPAFGAGGGGIDSLRQPFTINAVAVQPDGKIVAAGFLAQADSPGGTTAFGVARFNPDGTFDTGFGTGGEVETDFAGGWAWARRIILQGDGKIVVVGDEGLDSLHPDHIALARYNPDGSLDTGFGTGGTTTTQLDATNVSITGVALQTDGQLVVAADGLSKTGAAPEIVYLHYGPDGRVVGGFVGGGNAVGGQAPQGGGTQVTSGTPSTPPGPIPGNFPPGPGVGNASGGSYQFPGGWFVESSVRAPGLVPWEYNLSPSTPLSAAVSTGAPSALLFWGPTAFAAQTLTYTPIGQGAPNPAGAQAGMPPDAGAADAFDPIQTAGTSAPPSLLPSYLAPDPGSAVGGTRAGIGHGAHTAADAVFGQPGGLLEEGEDEAAILAAAAEDATVAVGEAVRPRTSSLWWVSACLLVLLAEHAREDRSNTFSPPSL